MESNSDKQLRDKLKGMEYPFDPKAWDGMEEMLDRKKRRKGFFWWWAGGIAAALLFGTIGYELHEVVNGRQLLSKTEDPRPAGGGQEGSMIKENSSEALTAASAQEGKNESGALAVGGGQQSTIGNERVNDGRSVQNPKSGIRNQGNSQSNQRQNSGITKGINKRNKSAHSEEGSGIEKIQRRNKHKVKGEQENTALNTEILQKKQTAKTSLKQEKEAPGFTPFKNEFQLSTILFSPMSADALKGKSETGITDFAKREGDLLPKRKRRIFHYAVGILANVTGTTLGGQSENKPQRPSLFYKTPSYMAGLTQDFLFMNRIALTNSILFSQTSFKVYTPQTISFSKTPKEYSCHVTELDIPIGIKIYLTVRKKFRFYINTGIINHIKFKETFDYTLPADTVYNSGLNASSADNVFFPEQTNFVKNNTNAVNQQGYSNSTKDFSINSAKRYYTSFYTSAGFEYLPQKHFILFAEPMFYMSLQKIGVQDKRKYNFGVSGGMRYQF